MGSPGSPATLVLKVSQPGQNRQRQNQHAHPGREIAVNHFNPGLGVGDRAGRHGALRGLDMHFGAHGAGAAIAARPVRATKPGVRQPGEGAENHQVKSQKERDQREHLQSARDGGIPVARPYPRQRPERHHQAHDHQAQRRAEVVKIGGSHEE